MSSSQGSKPLLRALVALLIIISLGGLYALYNQYQNNVYQRQYVSENASLVYVGILVLLVLGIISAYAVHRMTSATPTSRLRRLSQRLAGLAPVILGLVSLLAWFTILASVFGGSLENFELYVVAVLSTLSLALILRDRITFRMSLRNFTGERPAWP